MTYDLATPCGNCPFRTDCMKGWLGESRAEEIVESGGEFPCHKTTEHDDDDEVIRNDKNEKHCAGMLILLEKIEQPNQMMRICERIGMYDRRKLNMDAPVFDSPEEFIQHHGERKQVRCKRRSGAAR